MPLPEEDHQFLQIYFTDNTDAKDDRHWAHNPTVRRTIVQVLQTFLHQNDLVKMFKIALEQIIIRAGKTPAGEPARRFISMTIDEVATVIVRENLKFRNIILHHPNNVLKHLSEMHSTYDALQYPLIFSQGEDRYHFNIKMVNQVTGKYIKKD